MDIYEYAMQMEVDGERYYRELASITENPGLKNILTMLADAEVKHYHIFQKMKNNEKAETTDAEFLSGVKNIFVQMREKKEVLDVEKSQIELYEKAQDIEKKSEEFYLEKSDEVEEPERKEMFRKIAREEKRHYAILQNIIDFVSKPDTWLENPEWYHLDEY